MLEEISPRSPRESLRGLLRWTRRQRLRTELLTALCAWFAGSLVLLMLAAWGMALGLSPFVRTLALLLVGAGALVAAVLAFRRGGRTSAEAFARRLEAELPAAKGLLSALELEEALETPDFPYSRELAAAHVEEVLRRVEAPLRQAASDRRSLVLAARAALGTATAFLLGMSIWPQDFGRLMGVGVPEPGPARRAEPITGDVSITYHYPAYTGLPPRTIEGTTGELSALRGTEARIETRADRPVARAYVEIDGVALPLEVEGGRILRGTIRLQSSTRYAFRFDDERGRVVARGPEIAITVLDDQSPSVRIEAPVAELVVTERDTVEIQYEATDDFGVSRLELVYKVGPTEEQTIPLGSPRETPRRVSKSFTWDLATLDLRPGETVTYYVRAQDNDAVSGPKWGQSPTQVLKIFSEAEHRRKLLARAEEAWEQMIGALGDRIEPREGPRKVEGEARVEAGRKADEQVAIAVNLLREVTAEFAGDELAPPELFAALQNVTTQLSRKAEQTRATRARSPRVRQGRELYLRQLDEAEAEEQLELERGVLYLESLLDRQRILEIEALSRELADSRAELTRLIESLQEAPTDEARQAVLRELSRLRRRIEEMMQRMAELSRGIQDEFLNLEAQRALAQERDLLGQLDEVEKKIQEGDLEGALAEMQKLAMQMDALTEAFGEAADSQIENDPALQKLAEDLEKFERELAELQSGQQALVEETEQLRQEQIRRLQERFASEGRDPLDELLSKVRRAREALAALPENELPRLAADDLRGAVERAESLEHALIARDFDAALESVVSSIGYALALVQGLERERNYAERFGIGSTTDLDSWLESARASLPLLEDVRELLERMFAERGRLSRGQQQRLDELGRRQQELAGRMESLRHRAQAIGEQAPIFDDDAFQTMEQAGQSMRQAAGELDRQRIGEALSAERRAREQLEILQQGLKQARQQARSRGGGRGFPLPMGAFGRRGGSGAHFDGRERVEIPDADRFQAPEAYRKEILDAMKKKAPDAFQGPVQDYYEEIVK